MPGPPSTPPAQATPGEVLAALPSVPRSAVAALAGAFAAAGEELFLVGGVVRDLLLGRALPPTPDLDFATSAPTETTQRLGLEAGAASVYLVGERFGTVGFVFADPVAPPPPDGHGGEGSGVAASSAPAPASLDAGAANPSSPAADRRAADGVDPAAAMTVEVTTYRREHYPDGTRHPAVELGGTLVDDLARRDFTANAIAADAATGALVDPFDGRADLALGVLRAVGDPDARFQEDPLRLLRAARFVAQLGFRIDPGTAAAMARTAPQLARISRERVLAELTKLLVGDYAEHGLEVLRETGLLAVALPELAPLARATGGDGVRWGRGGFGREKDLWAHTKRVVAQAPPRPVVRWVALLHDAAKPQTRSVDAAGEVHFFGHELQGAKLAAKLLRRLNADRATQQAVARLVELHARPESYAPDWTDSAVRRLALEAGEVLDDLLDLAAADVTSGRAEKRRAAADRVAGLRAHLARLEAERALAQLQSPLDGDELMALFARPPGRWIAVVKDHLRDLVIDGQLDLDDKATAERIARELVASGAADA